MHTRFIEIYVQGFSARIRSLLAQPITPAPEIADLVADIPDPLIQNSGPLASNCGVKIASVFRLLKLRRFSGY